VKDEREEMNKRRGDRAPVDRDQGDWLGITRMGLNFPSTAAEPHGPYGKWLRSPG